MGTYTFLLCRETLLPLSHISNMESVLTFKRGIDPKEAMDIGEVHFLKSNIGFLQDHPAIVSLYTENKDNETVVIGREAFLFTGRLIHILIDVSKTTSSDPGKFLIEYLPAKYFSRVDAYD